MEKKVQKKAKQPVKKTAKKGGNEKVKTQKTAKSTKMAKKAQGARTTKSKNTVKIAKTAKVVVPPSQKEKQKRSLKEKILKRKAIIIAGAVILVALIASAIGVGVLVAANNEEPVVIEETTVIEEEPEEEPEPEEPALPEVNTDALVPEPGITDATTYQVAAYKPRYLSIPTIGLYNIPITEVGMWAGGQLGSPTNIRVVGWYYRSAFPGQPGVSVMDAHGGDLGNGIFKSLPQVVIGTEIIIEMGDGRKFTYVVAEKAYKAIGTEADNYMDVAYQTLPGGVPTLSLITCTGRWIREQQTYDQRLFVRASLK